jgi:hypothetical protein
MVINVTAENFSKINQLNNIDAAKNAQYHSVFSAKIRGGHFR